METPSLTSTKYCSLQSVIFLYLLCYEPEALVGPLTLVRLSQHWVEGLASCPVVGGGVRRHCKGGHIHLEPERRRIDADCQWD